MAADVSPKSILAKITGGEWDQPNFQRGNTSFQVRKIGALEEDSVLDDILEALGLSAVEQLRYVLMESTDPAVEPLRLMAAIKLFLSIPKLQKRALRDRMFKHVYFSNQFTGEGKWKALRAETLGPRAASTDEDAAFKELRGMDVQIVFYRALYSTFRDSFSNLD